MSYSSFKKIIKQKFARYEELSIPQFVLSTLRNSTFQAKYICREVSGISPYIFQVVADPYQRKLCYHWHYVYTGTDSGLVI
jgi:hypothetical protein